MRSVTVTPARLRAKSHRETSRMGGAAMPLTSMLSISMSAVTSAPWSTDFIVAEPFVNPSMLYPFCSAICVRGVTSKFRRRSVTESPRLREATPSMLSSCSRFITRKRSISTRAVSIRIFRAKICQVLSPRVMCDGMTRSSMTRLSEDPASASPAHRLRSPEARRVVSLKPAESCRFPCFAPPDSARCGRCSTPA